MCCGQQLNIHRHRLQPSRARTPPARRVHDPLTNSAMAHKRVFSPRLYGSACLLRCIARVRVYATKNGQNVLSGWHKPRTHALAQHSTIWRARSTFKISGDTSFDLRAISSASSLPPANASKQRDRKPGIRHKGVSCSGDGHTQSVQAGSVCKAKAPEQAKWEFNLGILAVHRISSDVGIPGSSGIEWLGVWV